MSGASGAGCAGATVTNIEIGKGDAMKVKRVVALLQAGALLYRKRVVYRSVSNLRLAFLSCVAASFGGVARHCGDSAVTHFRHIRTNRGCAVFCGCGYRLGRFRLVAPSHLGGGLCITCIIRGRDVRTFFRGNVGTADCCRRLRGGLRGDPSVD